MSPMAERVGSRLKRWKTKPILRAAHLGALGIGEAGEVDAVDQHGAAGGLGEAAEDVKKRRFAGARGSDDGDELAGVGAKS